MLVQAFSEYEVSHKKQQPQSSQTATTQKRKPSEKFRSNINSTTIATSRRIKRMCCIIIRLGLFLWLLSFGQAKESDKPFEGRRPSPVSQMWLSPPTRNSKAALAANKNASMKHKP